MKKNVCMIVYTRYIQDLRVRREAETLAALPEFNVSILIPKIGKVPQRHIKNNVQLIEINEKKYTGKSSRKYLFSYFKFLLLSFLTCTRLFISGQIDIVHIHNMPNFLVLSGIIPRLFGKTLILDIHDSVPETYMVKFKKFSPFIFKLLCLEEFFFCFLVQKIICVNHVQRDVLVKRGIPLNKITISMNVPDDKWFNSKHTKKIKDDKFKIVYHGLVTERLGVDLIIYAVSQLANNINRFECHIWGKGDSQRKFNRLIEDLNLQDIVYWKPNGFIPEQLPSKLINMDLGVIGNRKNMATELMLPVKLLEYVALGIPVVVPRLKAIEYYFSDEMVYFYEPENTELMASAILELYKDQELRKTKSENSMKFIHRYGWYKHKMDLINLYRSL